MPVLQVEVTAHQPLMLGRRPTGNAPADTHLHVPGSVLRGALAAAWIAEHGPPQGIRAARRHEFVELFERRVRFEPLFAPGSGIVPLSVRRCKYRPEPGCAGWWHDEAFDTAEAGRHCPTCAGPTELAKGAVEFSDPDARVITQRTRVEIDDETQTAAEGMLFTRRALWHREPDEEARVLRGRIVTPPDLPEPLLHWLATRRPLRLGGRRSTGGAVDYAAGDEASTAPTANPPSPGQRVVALRLAAPAILTDASGLPTTSLEPAEVEPALETRVEVTGRWIRWERVGGWHAASNLPKPDEPAVSAGSVFTLELGQNPARDALSALVDRGIGLRRAEGFGTVEIGTRRWQPPAVPGDRRREPVPTADAAERYARMLRDTGLGGWFRTHLREHARARARGADPDTGLPQRSTLDKLDPGQSEQLRSLLHEPDVETLGRTLTLLDALRRGVLE